MLIIFKALGLIPSTGERMTSKNHVLRCGMFITTEAYLCCTESFFTVPPETPGTRSLLWTQRNSMFSGQYERSQVRKRGFSSWEEQMTLWQALQLSHLRKVLSNHTRARQVTENSLLICRSPTLQGT